MALVPHKLSGKEGTVCHAFCGSVSSPEIDHLNVKSKVIVPCMNKIIGF